MIDLSKQTALQTIVPVSIAETDCTGRVKPVVIFNYMQDLAAKSIEKYGFQYGCEGLAQKGLGWFIIRYRLEFEDYPVNIKELKLLTESRGVQKLTAYRDFEVYDNKTGNRLLRGASSWFIVNLKEKSVVNIKQEFPEFLNYDKREDDLQLRKLHTLDRIDTEKVFHVRYDDIDINNHVNNTVYITWALEALSYAFRVLHRLKSMDIYFKHDIQYGDDILSQVKFDDENNSTEHVIKNAKTGEELCLLKMEFIKN